MSTRWLVIVVVAVFVVVLAVTLAISGGDGDGPAPVTSPQSSPSTGATASVAPSVPASPSASPGPTPLPSASPATSFSATGDLVAGWYWLRDAEHAAAATWDFATLPASGDLTLAIEVLATDAVDGAGDQDARFFLAWAPAPPSDPTGWSGRLPVTLANVSLPDDPVGYACRGTVTIPRSTITAATTLTVRISRDDVRGELVATDVHVGVQAASVTLRFP